MAAGLSIDLRGLFDDLLETASRLNGASRHNGCLAQDPTRLRFRCGFY